jgi:phosphate transport system permease protein
MALKKRKPKDVHRGDRVFALTLKTFGLSVAFILLAIAIFLSHSAMPAFKNAGIDFFFKSAWDPVQNDYGALPVIFGTVVSSLLALLLATPMSIGIALFLTELAPYWMSQLLGYFTAFIPSLAIMFILQLPPA